MVVFLTPGQAPFGREGFSPTIRTSPPNRCGYVAPAELEEVIVVGEVDTTREAGDALFSDPHAKLSGKAAQFARA